ncbi:hypothetical protein ACNQ1T_03305 [Mycoplasma sp. 1932B]|uniref:hypothetical protein n=1 Tax=Mycoplasma sp. 1932B TaxID=3401670 RepID=UPI003AB068C6
MQKLKNFFKKIGEWFKWLKISSVEATISLLDNVTLEPEQIQQIQKILDKYKQ